MGSTRYRPIAIKFNLFLIFFSVCVSGARVLMTIRDAVSRKGYHVLYIYLKWPLLCY